MPNSPLERLGVFEAFYESAGRLSIRATRAGPDAGILVGILRNGDTYREIGMHRKAASPASQTSVSALANGSVSQNDFLLPRCWPKRTFPLIGQK